MADNRFCNSSSESKWRKEAERYRGATENKVKKEEEFLKKQREIKKYEGVVNIITQNISKRKNIKFTYRGLYPIIKEIIENSKYLSSRYSEEDIPKITSYVVEKCHFISSNDSKDNEERNI